MALQSGIFVTDFDVAGVSGNVVLQNEHSASETAVRLSQVKALGKQVEHQEVSATNSCLILGMGQKS